MGDPERRASSTHRCRRMTVCRPTDDRSTPGPMLASRTSKMLVAAAACRHRAADCRPWQKPPRSNSVREPSGSGKVISKAIAGEGGLAGERVETGCEATIACLFLHSQSVRHYHAVVVAPLSGGHRAPRSPADDAIRMSPYVATDLADFVTSRGR